MGTFLDGLGSFLKKGLDDVEGVFGGGPQAQHSAPSPAPQMHQPASLQMAQPRQQSLAPVQTAQPTLQPPKLNVSGAPANQVTPIGGHNPIQEFDEWANNNIVKPTIGFGQRAINTGEAGAQAATGLLGAASDALAGQNVRPGLEKTYSDIQNTLHGNNWLGGHPIDGGPSSLITGDDATTLNKPAGFVGNVTSTAGQVAPWLLGPEGKVAGEALGTAGRVIGNTIGSAATMGGGMAIGNAIQQAGNNIDGTQHGFDMGQANQAGTQGALFGAGGHLVSEAAPIVGDAVKQGVQAGADIAKQAVSDVAQNLHDNNIANTAARFGQPASFAHPDFDPNLVSSATPADLKRAEGYFNQLKKGEDLGSIATSTNERGYVEPRTKDGFARYLAIKEANDQIEARNANDQFAPANPYAHVKTNHIDEETLQNGMRAMDMQRAGGYIAGPGAKDFMADSPRNFEGPDGKARFEVSDATAKIANPDGKTLGEVLDHPKLYANYPELKDVKVKYDDDLDPGSASYSSHNNTIEYGEGGNNVPTLLHELQHAIQDKEDFAKGGEVPESVNPEDVIKHTPEYTKWQAELKQLNEEKLQRDGQGPEGESRSQRAEREQRIYKLQRQMFKAEYQEAHRQYSSLAGEAEARAVAARADMTDGERYRPPKNAKAGPRSTFYDSLDVPKDQLIVNHDGGTAMSIDPALHNQIVHEAVASFSSPEAYRKSLIDSLVSEHGKGKGVALINTGETSSSKTRISNNSQFYRDFYKQYGKGPTRKAITDMVDQVLTGKPGEYNAEILLDSMDPEEALAHQDIYGQLEDRQASRANVQGSKDTVQIQDADGNYVSVPKEQLNSFAPVDRRAPGSIQSKEITDKITGPAPEPTRPATYAEKRDALGIDRKNQPAALKIAAKNDPVLGKVKSGERGTMKDAWKPVDRTARPINIPDVKAGDYEKVRSNAQLVEAGVNTRARQTINAINKLDEEDKAEFWHSVEDPRLPRTPELDDAIKRWHDLSDTAVDTSNALGGDTPYRANYGRHNWDLSDPEQAAKFEELKQKKADFLRTADSADFRGIDRNPRVFETVQEGEDAGFKLKHDGDPAKDIEEYAHGTVSALKRQVLVKGLEEAEEGMDRRNYIDLKDGRDPVPVSEQGVHEMRTYTDRGPSKALPVKVYRKFNHSAKQVVLSISQFHPININLLQAAPSLLIKGHPIRAFRGLVDSVASLSPEYSDQLQQAALKDGTMDNAARIGTPINYGNDFTTSGKINLKSGLGERMIFERQLPAMHVQMVKAVVQDLEDRGVSLDSPEARKAGTEINQIMGYVNMELKNFDPRTQRGLGDVLLAPQFTRSKWAVLRDAFMKGGQAGSYARAAVAGKYLAEAAIIAGVGAALGQKSDDLKDLLIRALLKPSIPTPLKDGKGNNINLSLPANFVSEVAPLAGVSAERGDDGHLHIKWDPNQIIPNAENYGRSRLAIVPGDVLKLATNTDYAGKPLYDPNAPMGDQAIQAATTLTNDNLPIGLQGIAREPAINGTLPGPVKQILKADNGGDIDPITSAVLQAAGVTPRTDTTTGKGLQTAQYFNALDAASHGLNNKEQASFAIATGSKKNPVTGAYDVMPNANDTRAKATALLDQPTALSHLIQMNKDLASKGQSIDPLFSLTPDQIKKYYEYQAMPPGGADRSKWQDDNAAWYTQDFQNQRNQYFNTLPAGDPNRPQLDIQPPQTTPKLDALLTAYDGLADPAQKSALIQANPEISDYFSQMSDYTNKMRVAQGYDPLRSAPKADANTEDFMNKYFAADSNTRKTLRTQYPEAYLAMQNYEDNMSRYGLDKAAAKDQLVGPNDDPNAAPAQAYLKNAFNLGQYGIAKGVDANGNTTYDYFPSTNAAAGSTTGANNAVKITQGGSSFKGIGGYSGSSSSYHKKQKKQKIRVKYKKVRYTYLKSASRRGPVKSMKIAHEVGYSKNSGAIKITKPKVEV